jgi:hypothetical protein
MEWIPCSGISKRATKNKKNNDNNNKNRVIVNQKPLDQTKTSPGLSLNLTLQVFLMIF